MARSTVRSPARVSFRVEWQHGVTRHSPSPPQKAIMARSPIASTAWLVAALTSLAWSQVSALAQEAASAKALLAAELPEFAIARLGGLRFKHPSRVKELAFSPDGRTMATVALLDVRLWDLAEGTLVGLARQGFSTSSPGECRPVFYPPGKTLAVPSRDGLLVWNLTGDHKVRYLGKDHRPRHCAFVSRGALLVWDRFIGASTLEIYDRTVDRQLPAIPLPAPVAEIAVAAETNRVLIAFDNGSVALCDVKTGNRIWPTETEWLKPRPSRPSFLHVAITPNGKTIAIASDGELATFDIVSGEKRNAIKLMDAFVMDLHFITSRGSTMLAAVLQDREVGLGETKYFRPELTLYDVATGKQRSRHELREQQYEFAVSQDGTMLADRSGVNFRLRRLLDFSEPSPRAGHDCDVAYVQVLTKGRLLSWGTDVRSVVWDLAKTEPLLEVVNQDLPFRATGDERLIALCPTEKRMAVSQGKQGIEFWNVDDCTREMNYTTADLSLTAMQFSPHDDLLAYGDEAGNVSLFEFSSGKVQQRWKMWANDSPQSKPIRSSERLPFTESTSISISARASPKIQSLSWSPDGRTLLVGSPSGIRAIELASGVIRAEGFEATEQVDDRFVAFSPDGKLLMELRDGKQCLVTDVASGKLAWKSEAGQHLFLFATSLACSPDSRLIAGAHDDSVRLVEARTGLEVTSFTTGHHRATSICFSADGEQLACGGRNGTVLIFDLEQVLRAP